MIYLYEKKIKQVFMKQPIRKRVSEANGIQQRKPQYICIIDGNNLLKIALVDNRMNSSGLEYGGVFMFLKMLGSVLSVAPVSGYT